MSEDLIITEEELNSLLNNLDLKFIAQKLKIENVDKSIITLIKIVRSLQQENKQLKEKIDILLEDNNQLEEIRIKAIKYIKEKQWFSYTKGHNIIDEVGIEDLLQILGENENE